MIGLFPHIIVHLILLKGSHGCVSNGHYPAMVGCGENKWVPCNNGEKQPKAGGKSDQKQKAK